MILGKINKIEFISIDNIVIKVIIVIIASII